MACARALPGLPRPVRAGEKLLMPAGLAPSKAGQAEDWLIGALRAARPSGAGARRCNELFWPAGLTGCGRQCKVLFWPVGSTRAGAMRSLKTRRHAAALGARAKGC